MSSGSFPPSEVTFHVPIARVLVQGLGRRGPPPRLLPKPHCTGPSWTFLAGGEPTGRRAHVAISGLARRSVPWAKTRPPSARLRAPNPGLLQGGAQYMLEMAMDSVEVAALGRPFNLGMLYDARKDQLIPGLTLWDDKTLQNKATKSSQHSSDFDISASDSIESKSSLLDVGASLKASFMSGLIQVGGSGKFLNDTKKFKNQSRVTFQYKATTDFKQLSVTQLPAMDTQQMEIIKKSSATHVVTGILYGANAFFVFDSEKLEAKQCSGHQGPYGSCDKEDPFN
ncbi:hypothetical protein L3Q82_000940 [Scortum barcoo]|uniref:Uncharacterized protein n=1 Tax=Scortum barcoo TaxID=214431 RepID=A0ACB8WAA2_9TELE|nr:hypothetical protein L3Q82_000940 [Scortum barcoo]